MANVPTEMIRNVALVGHGGAGKTTLAEALLFVAGEIPRMGRVEDHNTVCDFDPEEHKRRISVSLAQTPTTMRCRSSIRFWAAAPVSLRAFRSGFGMNWVWRIRHLPALR